MKATGMVRHVDELGRIVLPKELRRTMDIKDRDALEIFTEDGNIILRKYEPSCVFCNSMEDVVLFCDKRVCRSCLNKLKETV